VLGGLALGLLLTGCARLTLAEAEAKQAQPIAPSSGDSGAPDASLPADGGTDAQPGSGDGDSNVHVPPPDAGGNSDAGGVPHPALDSGTLQQDASQPPPVDAGMPPDDMAPDPSNSSQCPDTAPPLFQLSPCVAITLKCHYGSSYTCTCYAAGWTCFD
jgi:hypothetical protein